MSIPSHRLVSLLEMLRVFAHDYLQAGRTLNDLGGLLYMSEAEDGDPGRPLTPAQQHELMDQMERMRAHCAALGLTVAQHQFGRASTNPPRSSRELDILVSVMETEIEKQLFLFVPAERASFFERDRPIPSFPNATKELGHAGNCFAVGEYVACVFHSMRAVEITLNAVYACLSLIPPVNSSKSWGIYLNAIRDEMKRRGNGWSRLDEFQDIHATLVAVKDGWRNQSLHVDAAYTETDALRILEAVTFFIEKVSLKLDESGLPLA